MSLALFPLCNNSGVISASTDSSCASTTRIKSLPFGGYFSGLSNSGEICVSSLFSRSHSVLLCRLLWWTSLSHSQNNDYCFISVIQKVGYTDWKVSWRKFNGLVSLCCTPTTQNYQDSRGLMANYRILKIFCVDKYAMLSFQTPIIWWQGVWRNVLACKDIFTHLWLT